MSKTKFLYPEQGFPRDEPWLMPVEAYRKLWNLGKRNKAKEFGGYIKDGTIFYGSSHGFDSIDMWPTEDIVSRHDFPHPSRNMFRPPAINHFGLGLVLFSHLPRCLRHSLGGHR